MGCSKEAACIGVLCKWKNDFVKKYLVPKKKTKLYKDSTEMKKNSPAKRFMPATTSKQKSFPSMLNQIPDRSKFV